MPSQSEKYPYFRPIWSESTPFSDINNSKTIFFGASHTFDSPYIQCFKKEKRSLIHKCNKCYEFSNFFLYKNGKCYFVVLLVNVQTVIATRPTPPIRE